MICPLSMSYRYNYQQCQIGSCPLYSIEKKVCKLSLALDKYLKDEINNEDAFGYDKNKDVADETGFHW